MFFSCPWGSFTILDEGDSYQVKRIHVSPGCRLSYQIHAHRSEHWMVVQGVGLVKLDGHEVPVSPGESVDIPVSTPHRIGNTGSEELIFIEVQRGTYFGEDDIVRLEDDFGRL